MIRFHFKDQEPLGQMTITPQTNIGIYVEMTFRWRADCHRGDTRFPISQYTKAWPHSFNIHIVDIGVSSS